MIQEQGYYYYIVRYHADPIRNEFVNIGIILILMDGGNEVGASVRFTQNWRRLLCQSPEADLELLGVTEREWNASFAEAGPNAAGQIRRMSEQTSNTLRIELGRESDHVQVSDRRSVLSQTPDKLLDQLMALYVEEGSIYERLGSASPDDPDDASEEMGNE